MATPIFCIASSIRLAKNNLIFNEVQPNMKRYVFL